MVWTKYRNKDTLEPFKIIIVIEDCNLVLHFKVYITLTEAFYF